MTLDRRRFLQLTAAGVVASLTDTACRGTGEDSGTLTQPALIEMLGSARVREIGTQYRAAFPKENTAAALRDAISRSQHPNFPLIWRRSVEDQVRDDFAAGRTLLVSGWVLSETEARQCALYSLSV
jgi:hypothetical protein